MTQIVNLGESAKVVALFDDQQSFAELQSLLSELHYSAVCAMDSDGMTIGDATLAIVNGESPGALEAWRAMAPTLPTLLISNDQSFEARIAAARQGIDGVLESPVYADELSGWLRHFEGQKPSRPICVLIVDDDEIASHIYAETLRNAHMSVSCVADAQSAFDHLGKHPVDLMLMDVQMPEVDGIRLAQVIRQKQANLSLPIIFLSGERDPARQMEARHFGGDDFIVKPVSPKRLLSLVELRLERAHALQDLIERDSLTGLYNHGRFKEILEHEMERSRRTGSELSVALIDIDRFKAVNDTYGHLVGDRVIRSVSSLLTNRLRKIDIIGRWGGEEFAVIFLDTPDENAAAVIDRARDAFSQMQFAAGDQRFNVSFSAGVCEHVDGMSAADIVARADEALYHAKEAGRARTIISQDGTMVRSGSAPAEIEGEAPDEHVQRREAVR